jgi:hypothetical protein
VAPRIACTACKHEVFFAIRLRHSRLQLIHIFQGVCPTISVQIPSLGKTKWHCALVRAVFTLV